MGKFNVIQNRVNSLVDTRSLFNPNPGISITLKGGVVLRRGDGVVCIFLRL